MNDGDYSVTWNEIKDIVDGLIDGNKKVSMCEINRAIESAWNKIYVKRRMQEKQAELEQQGIWINEMLR